MRVLMLSQFYDPVVGGEERIVQDLSQALAGRGHAVSVATLRHEGQAAEQLDGPVRVHRVGSLVGHLPGVFQEEGRRHAPPFPDPQALLALRRIVARERPDVVHAHNWLAHAFLPLRRRSGPPLVLSLHDYSLVCAKKRFVYRDAPCSGPGVAKCLSCSREHYGALKGVPITVGNWTMGAAERRLVDLFLPVSRAVAEGSGLTASRLPHRVIPNFLPDDAAHPAAASDPRLALLPPEYVLFVGDLSPDKGVHVLLRAHARLADPPPLVLIGRVPTGATIEASPGVFVLGPWPHELIMQAWRRCTVAVVPSLVPESFGLVALEAMASRRPVVASRVGGLHEVLDGGDAGLLVEPGDPRDLTQALSRLLADRHLRERLGAAGARRARAFTASAVVPRVEDAYHDVLGTERPVAPPAPAHPERGTRARAPARPAPRERRLERAHEPHDRSRTPARPAVSRRSLWGWAPALSVTFALGLLVVAIADALARSGGRHAQLLFWVGLLTLVVPVAARLASARASRRERLSLLVGLGASLYLVKAIRDPFAFTFSDELVHAYNADQILRTHHLFSANPILPATPGYPGLETLGSALSALGGWSTFAAGVVVLLVARVMLVVALFLLLERVSGSTRVAGIGALVYMANPNFIYFSAEYSYQSLALPLAVVAILALRRWQDAASRRDRVAWALAALLLISATVMTHHMTTYVLVGLLVLVCVVSACVPWLELRRSPWPFAAFAAAAAGAWLVLAAAPTVDYLTPVFHNAIDAVLRTASREEPVRQLFASTSGAQPPVWERTTSVAAIALLAAAQPFGLRALWKRHRDDPWALVLGLAALAYFGSLGLRLVPAAWEVGNRASEILFLGVAFVVALARPDRFAPRRAPWLGAAVVTAGATVLFIGGFVAGWPVDQRLARPYEVRAGHRTLLPQGLRAAWWARDALGPGKRIGVDPSNGRLLLVYGRQNVIVGAYPNVPDVLTTPMFPGWQREILRNHAIRYLVVDRRRVSRNPMTGAFFPLLPVDHRTFPPEVSRKFDRQPGSSRIYDSGDLAVYDVRGVWHAPSGG